MRNHADGSVHIQTTASSVPSTPSWFGEVVLLIGYLCKQDILAKISERGRFTRRRFGRYDVIDFLVVQIALPRQLRAHRWRLDCAVFCRS